MHLYGVGEMHGLGYCCCCKPLTTCLLERWHHQETRLDMCLIHSDGVHNFDIGSFCCTAQRHIFLPSGVAAQLLQ